jgi:hypothetical protein
LKRRKTKNRFKHMRQKRYSLTRGNDLLLKGIGVANQSRAALTLEIGSGILFLVRHANP